VRVGDHVRPRDGVELSVTRIEHPFLGLEEMLAFIEASNARWLKVPTMAGTVVEVRRRLR
jgi:hypothetical protein